MRALTLLLVAMIWVLSGNASNAEPKGGSGISGPPPHISTTGREHRSPTANTKGANNPKFCPPGQRRKPGKGSAFNC
jgi:hypothetical protein